MPDVTLGNIREGRLVDIWQHSDLLDSLADHTGLKGSCGDCEFKAFCGGCRARAYAYFGDFKGPDPGCIRNQYYFELTAGAKAAAHVPIAGSG